MENLNPGEIIVLRCLGTIDGPRFLDGRTGNGSVSLAPGVEMPFTGTKWLVQGQRNRLSFICLGDVDGPRYLDGRTVGGTVGLAPNTKPPYSGTAWDVQAFGSGMAFRCLGAVEGPRFLDGRTLDGTVGLAPSTEPPFSGTVWEIGRHGVLNPRIESLSLIGGDPKVRAEGVGFSPNQNIVVSTNKKIGSTTAFDDQVMVRSDGNGRFTHDVPLKPFDLDQQATVHVGAKDPFSPTETSLDLTVGRI